MSRYNNNTQNYGGGFYVDVDTRPKSFPCRHCGRDVTQGKRCFCVASLPVRITPRDGSTPTAFIVR